MQDKEVRSKFEDLKSYIEGQGQGSTSSQALIKCQEELQKSFENLSTIINDYTTKKEQNQKNFTSQIQTCLSSLFEETGNIMNKSQNLIQTRGHNWLRINEKMQIYLMFRKNLKQMFSINKKYKETN